MITLKTDVKHPKEVARDLREMIDDRLDEFFEDYAVVNDYHTVEFIVSPALPHAIEPTYKHRPATLADWREYFYAEEYIDQISLILQWLDNSHDTRTNSK